MATTPRPSTASGKLRTKTSELSDLFRGRQQSSAPSTPAQPSGSTKPKRKIPLFSLRKKSSAPSSSSDAHLSSTSPSVPTPRPSTNTLSPSLAESSHSRTQYPQLTIPSSSFSPLPAFDDASSSKRSSSSPTNSRSTRSMTRTPSSQNSTNKSRTPTPTSAITLGGGSFSDSEPPRSNSRTPTALLRSYASDDEERRYLSARSIPPSKPAPTKALPPPPESTSFSLAYPTPTTPTSPPISFPSPAGSYSPLPSDAKVPPSGVRKFAVSTSATRSPSFKMTSGSESASESAYGYTSASGSESATGLGLGFRIRTRSGQGNSSDNGSTSRTASVRVGLLRAPNPSTAPRATSPPVSMTKSSSSASRPSLERTGTSRSVLPSQSTSVKRASPPMHTTPKSSSELPGRRQTEPTTTTPSTNTKHASWLVIPKPANPSVVNPQGQVGGHDIKVTAPIKRARAASDSRTLSTGNAGTIVGSNLPPPTTSGVSTQSITASRSPPALRATSPSNLLKSPSTAAAPVPTSGTISPPPAEPLPKLPRPGLSRTSSEISQQATSPSSSSPSSSESSTHTLTLPSNPSSTANAVSASRSGTISNLGAGSSNSVSSPLGSPAASAVKSGSSVTHASGTRRASTKEEKPTTRDRNKDSSWPPRSASKRSSPTVSSPLVQSHTSSGSPPYASPSSFSASLTAPSTSTLTTLQPPPSRVIVPIPPTPANIFALQTENADLRAEIASLRAQLENADRLARRREREIRGLRWLVINWGESDKKDTFGFAATTERRPSGDADTSESQEEVQAAVRYLRAESESGYGSGSVSGSVSGSYKRMSLSSAYSSVYPPESVSDGSGSEAGVAQRSLFGPGPSARASEDHALDAIPERTAIGDEDAQTATTDRRRKKDERDERLASRALRRLSASMVSDSSGSGLDEVVSQGMLQNNLAHGRGMSIEQVIEGDRARRERVGLKGMDEVLDKLRAAAGVAPPACEVGGKRPNDATSAASGNS